MSVRTIDVQGMGYGECDSMSNMYQLFVGRLTTQIVSDLVTQVDSVLTLDGHR